MLSSLFTSQIKSLGFVLLAIFLMFIILFRSIKLSIVGIIPNILAPVSVLFSTRLAATILVEAALSFIGLGVPPPEPSWGSMLSFEGRRYMFQAPWLAIIPGIVITIVVYNINMFGDAIRDLLDPRMRGSGRRQLISQ